MHQHPATASVSGLFKTLEASVQRARVKRYFARADEHMQDMDRDASLAFLRGELANWTARYQRFQSKVFAGEDMEGDVTAWDFAETIATIAARIARLERQRVAA